MIHIKHVSNRFRYTTISGSIHDLHDMSCFSLHISDDVTRSLSRCRSSNIESIISNRVQRVTVSVIELTETLAQESTMATANEIDIDDDLFALLSTLFINANAVLLR